MFSRRASSSGPATALAGSGSTVVTMLKSTSWNADEDGSSFRSAKEDVGSARSANDAVGSAKVEPEAAFVSNSSATTGAASSSSSSTTANVSNCGTSVSASGTAEKSSVS